MRRSRHGGRTTTAALAAALALGTVLPVALAVAIATGGVAGGIAQPDAGASSTSSPGPRALLLTSQDLPDGWSRHKGATSDDITRSACLQGAGATGAGWLHATVAFVRGRGFPAVGETLGSGPGVDQTWQRVTSRLSRCRSAEIVLRGKAHNAAIRPLAIPALGTAQTAIPAMATVWTFTVTRVEVGLELVVFEVRGSLGAIEYIDLGTPDPTTALSFVRAAVARAQGGAGKVEGTVSVATAKVQVARTRLGNVHFRAVGAGPPLVLIMGFGGTMATWDPRFVDALAHGHRVVVFDNAGIGGTARPPSTLTIDAMAQQTSALITALHLGAPDVLGWSMGGMIAQALAALHPTQVGHLVLCATFPGTGSVRPAQSAIDALESGVPSKQLGVLFPPNAKDAAATYSVAQAAYPSAPGAPASVIGAQSTAVVAWWHGNDDAGRRFASITTPSLVADGTQDRLDPTANDRRLAASITGATLLLYDDAGHAFLFQDQSAFVPAIERFLGAN